MYCVSQNRYTSNSMKKVGLFKGVTGQKAPMRLKAFYYIWDDLTLSVMESKIELEWWGGLIAPSLSIYWIWTITMKLPLQKLLQIIPRPYINHPNGRQEPPCPLQIHLQCKRTGQSWHGNWTVTMKLPIQKLLQIIHRTNIDHQNGRQEPPCPLQIHLQRKRTGQSWHGKLSVTMKLLLQKLLQIIHRTNITHQNGRQEPPCPLQIHLQSKRTGQSWHGS